MIGEIIWVAESMFALFLFCASFVFELTNSTSNRYQKAFVDFYEDELVRFDYDWKEVVDEYLFSGDEPVFNSIIADR